MMKWIRPFIDYVEGQRLVDSPDIAWIDAPGGGKAGVTGEDATRVRFLCNIDGTLRYVFISAVLGPELPPP
jgi:hypothetical protein